MKFTSSMLRPPEKACLPNQRIFWKLKSVSTDSSNTLAILPIFSTFFGCIISLMTAFRKFCCNSIRPASPTPPLL